MFVMSGMPKSAAFRAKHGLRICAIGGSTTEDILLDDESTWTHRVQEGIAKQGKSAEIVNTGVSGLRAANHLATLKVVAQLEPDLVISLIGANDWAKHIKDRFERHLWKPVDDAAVGHLYLRLRVHDPYRVALQRVPQVFCRAGRAPSMRLGIRHRALALVLL